ncbi:A24 family peptidase [Acinetobacter courvalinii]|uniref:prepilin peptidase n=1 Tax=Acinetobacter courvalinii TaxID=280147 RepID=UPI0021D1B1AD|nr:A24 family peptidase [Acinetobacter courvalinii]MCU4578544.1 A24 family peptidase [Acinetobacter courvalinii]
MQQMINYFIENPTALYLAVGLLSLCIGSFLNVVIFRTPKMMEQEWLQEVQMTLHPEQETTEHEKLTLSHPPSTCPQCASPIRWYQNIPIISWILLRGKCGNCQNPISIRYPLIELLTMICSLTVVMVFGATIQMLFGLIFTWVLIVLTFIDFDTQLLPDRFTLPLGGLGLGVNSFFLFTSPQVAIWGYILGFISLWTVATLYKLLRKQDGMGMGDFKLLAALGAWMGAPMLLLIILLSSVVGTIIGTILLRKHGESLPFAFGPYIAIAGWIAFLWGDQIMKVYLGG